MSIHFKIHHNKLYYDYDYKIINFQIVGISRFLVMTSESTKITSLVHENPVFTEILGPTLNNSTSCKLMLVRPENCLEASGYWDCSRLMQLRFKPGHNFFYEVFECYFFLNSLDGQSSQLHFGVLRIRIEQTRTMKALFVDFC